MPERILKVLTAKFHFAWIWAHQASRTCMVIAAALVALSVFYAGFAHAEVVYSWTKTFNTMGAEGLHWVTVDSSGNVYLTGGFSGTADFDPDPVTTDNHTSAGASDIFLTKFIMEKTAGFTVSPISGNTTEAGGQATFTVRLNSEPLADVIIPVTSSDTTEGTVDKSSLTFTCLNWNANQTVTVTGENDFVADGDQDYSILLGAATSADSGYNNLDPPDVMINNVDDDDDYGVGSVRCFIDTAAFGNDLDPQEKALLTFIN